MNTYIKANKKELRLAYPFENGDTNRMSIVFNHSSGILQNKENDGLTNTQVYKNGVPRIFPFSVKYGDVISIDFDEALSDGIFVINGIYPGDLTEQEPFIIKVNSGTDGTFTIPTYGGGYNYNIRTSDGQFEYGVGNGNKLITFPNTDTEYLIEISGSFPRIYFNNGTERLKLIDIKQWGDIKWTSMQNAFFGCSNLGTISATDVPDISSVTTMSSIFYNCTSLTTLDVSNWNVSSVTNMVQMFRNCSSLTTLDVSNWDVSSVTNMYYMFQACTSLTTLDVSTWNVSSVTNMVSMFYNCTSLTTLDVSNWDVSSVTNMGAMFYQCSSLATLDTSNWDVSNVTNMESMFYNAKYELISEIDFSDPLKGSISVTNIRRFCGYNNVSGTGVQVRIPKIKMQAGNVEIQTQQWLTYFNPFQSGYLTHLELIDLNVSWRITYSPNLLGTAIDDLANSVADMSGNPSPTITMTTAQYNSGIDETLWTNKNWIILT